MTENRDADGTTTVEMRDVDHERAAETEINRVFERGTEGRTDIV